MTEPFFLADDLADPLPTTGTSVVLGGPEGRHAAVVRRLRVGEVVVVTDGRGRAVRGPVTGVAKDSITVEVFDRVLTAEPDLRFVVVQALAKGDRSELAVEMLTEIGVAEIVPWQASRSIVRWSGERGDKGQGRWQVTAREAAKQSRRLRIPTVASVVSTEQLLARVSEADLALVLDERASHALRDVAVPESGTVVIIVGPEGGIADPELARLREAGGQDVLISDGVLRTSTAGVIACAGLMLR